MSVAFRTVGHSGLVVSELGLGTVAFGSRNRVPGGQPAVNAIVGAALDRLRAFTVGLDLTLVEVAYGWLLAQPGVTSLITGATSVPQVNANAAATSWRPDQAQEAYLRALFDGTLSGNPGRSA